MEVGVWIGSDFSIFRLDFFPESIGIDHNVNYRCCCHSPLPKLLRIMPPSSKRKRYGFSLPVLSGLLHRVWHEHLSGGAQREV
jgi:hypothetical protein